MAQPTTLKLVYDPLKIWKRIAVLQCIPLISILIALSVSNGWLSWRTNAGLDVVLMAGVGLYLFTMLMLVIKLIKPTFLHVDQHGVITYRPVIKARAIKAKPGSVISIRSDLSELRLSSTGAPDVKSEDIRISLPTNSLKDFRDEEIVL